MSTVIVKKSMKPMLLLRIRLNPNSRGQYLIVYQNQVIIVPPTKLVSRCLSTNDDEMNTRGIPLAARVTKLHLGGIGTLEVRILEYNISTLP